MAIKLCTCQHVFQDKYYGKFLRVHNETEKGYRCTVCGDEKLGKKDESNK